MICSRSRHLWKRSASLAVLMVCGAVFGPAALEAQTSVQSPITFTSAQTGIPVSVSISPWVAPAETTDSAGNVYLASNLNQLNRIAADGTETTISFSGLYAILTLSSDQAGNVYVYGETADSGGSRTPAMILLHPDGSQTAWSIPGAVNNDQFAGSDGAGNLYFYSFPGGNAVYKYNPSGNLLATISPSQVNLSAVSVDQAGNVYVLDGADGFYVASASSQYAATRVPQAFEYPGEQFGGANNFAVSDAQGILYFLYQNIVYKYAPGDNYPSPLAAVPGTAWQVAADGTGNLYVESLDGTLTRIEPNAASFGNVALCPQSNAAGCSQTLTLNFLAPDGVPASPLVAMQLLGQPTKDFAAATVQQTPLPSYGDWPIAVSNPQMLQASVTFTPQGVGTRTGAAQLVDSVGALYSTGYVYGTGVAPQAAFVSPVQVAVGSGFGTVTGMVADAAGNIFVADTENDRLVKLTPGGTQTTIASGLGNPQGLAIDGAGNLFTISARNSTVLEISPAGVQTTIATGVTNPQTLAVDPAGNLFLLDSGRGIVAKVTPGGLQTTVASHLGNTVSLAVDAAGNLFLGDNLNHVVLRRTPAGVQTTVASNVNNPFFLTVDPVGNLLIADQYSGDIVQVTPGGVQTTIESGFAYPTAVVSDNSGNIFVAPHNTSLVEFPRSAPALSFASTPVSNTSSPQAVQMENIGNAPLNLSNLSVSANFAQFAGPGSPEDCTASIALAPGSECNLSLSFTPLSAGSLTGSVILTDNALNANPTQQTILLSGTATLLSQTITFAAIPAQTTGASVLLSASATSGLPVVFTSTTPSICTVSGSTATMAAPGTCWVQATQGGNNSYAPAAPVSISFSVAAASKATFKLIARPNSETVRRGTVAAFLLEAQSENGFSGSVNITCSGGPATSVCGSFPQAVKLQSNGVAVALSGIMFPASTAPGTYTLTFTGTSGSMTVTTTAQFKIQN